MTLAEPLGSGALAKIAANVELWAADRVRPESRAGVWADRVPASGVRILGVVRIDRRTCIRFPPALLLGVYRFEASGAQ